MTRKIHLPCDGDGGAKSIKKEADTIEFVTGGSCKFTSFNFTGGSGNPYYPPNEASITRLVGALLLEQNDERQVQRRYMSLEALRTLSDNQPARRSAVVN